MFLVSSILQFATSRDLLLHFEYVNLPIVLLLLCSIHKTQLCMNIDTEREGWVILY